MTAKAMLRKVKELKALDAKYASEIEELERCSNGMQWMNPIHLKMRDAILFLENQRADLRTQIFNLMTDAEYRIRAGKL